MICAIIVAAGKGKRMGCGINKQYIKLMDKEVLAYSIEAFERTAEINKIIVVVGEDEIEYCTYNIIKKYGYKKVECVIKGGAERKDSVYNGLLQCPVDTEIVLIHDGARPFVSSSVIVKAIETARQYGACTVAVPVKDTIKVVDNENVIVKTLKREELYLTQTPQVFKYDMIIAAHKKSNETGSGSEVTDDTMLVEALGEKVRIVHGDYKNIKITTPEDITFGNAILAERVNEK